MDAFEALKGSSALKKMQRDQAALQIQQQLADELFGDAIKNASKGLVSANPQERMASETLIRQLAENPRAKNLGLDSFVGKLPAVDEPVVEAAAAEPAIFGTETTLKEKQQKAFQKYLDAGAPGSAAADMALAELKADRVLNEQSVKRVAEARERASALNELLGKAKAGVEGAGETGGIMYGPREFASKAFALVSGEEQKQRDAQALLDSISPDVIKATRAPGALTEREMDVLIRSGPSKRNTPSENRVLIDTMQTVANVQRDYADFIDAYVAERGDTRGADALWAKYKDANPLFVETKDGIVLNSQRQPWQDFDFSGSAKQTSRMSTSRTAEAPKISPEQARQRLRDLGVEGY